MNSHLYDVVSGGRVCPEADLGDTCCAFNVEPVNAETQVVHVVHVLLPGIELSPLVDVLPARRAPHVTRGHQPNLKRRIPLLFRLWDFGGVEVRGVVFVEHFSLRHFESLLSHYWISVDKSILPRTAARQYNEYCNAIFCS